MRLRRAFTIVAIHEVLSRRLEPHPKRGRTGQVVQASDREAKLFAVRKFAKAFTSTEQLFPGIVPCVLQDAIAHVEHALPMQTTEMQVIRPIHEMAQILTNVLLQLVKNNTGLFIGRGRIQNSTLEGQRHGLGPNADGVANIS